MSKLIKKLIKDKEIISNDDLNYVRNLLSKINPELSEYSISFIDMVNESGYDHALASLISTVRDLNIIDLSINNYNEYCKETENKELIYEMHEFDNLFTTKFKPHSLFQLTTDNFNYMESKYFTIVDMNLLNINKLDDFPYLSEFYIWYANKKYNDVFNDQKFITIVKNYEVKE